MRSVDIVTEPAFAFSNEQTLSVEGFHVVQGYRDYDMSPDGERLLMVFPVDQPDSGEPARPPDQRCPQLVRGTEGTGACAMIGNTLSHYKIIEKLGQGGMGEVYLAEDSRLDRKVALKILPEHLSDRAELRERFEREARAVSSLNHPHICTLYDIGEQDGIHYLVMEHLVGETLEARLAKGPLPLEQTLEYAIQIADALDKAHRQGVVHRDLKPGNIMLVKSGAKLLDFGLAKLQGKGHSHQPLGPAHGASQPHR